MPINSLYDSSLPSQESDKDDEFPYKVLAPESHNSGDDEPLPSSSTKVL